MYVNIQPNVSGLGQRIIRSTIFEDVHCEATIPVIKGVPRDVTLGAARETALTTSIRFAV